MPGTPQQQFVFFTELPDLRLITEGACADIGGVPIADQWRCEAAAAKLGLADTTALPVDLLGVPEGCYYLKDSRDGNTGLWLGTNKLNIGNGAETTDTAKGKQRQPICQLVAGAAHARSQATRFRGTSHTSSSTTSSSTTARPSTSTTHAASSTTQTATPEVTSAPTQTTTELPPTTAPVKAKKKLMRVRTEAEVVLAGDSESHSGTVPPVETLIQQPAAPVAGSAEAQRQPPAIHVVLEGLPAAWDALAAEHFSQASWSAKRVLKGISYSPLPHRGHSGLPDDDFMSSGSSAMWGKHGRGDLGIIKALGANAVRLYGNNPALDHAEFLDEAEALDLEVIAGISDYPYVKMDGSCKTTHFDCYHQIKEQYAQNLKKGFLKSGKAYHPALRTLILMNEPDVKLEPTGDPVHFSRALVSALDGVLDAEREAGVAGRLPNITATFSFDVCPRCSRYGYRPAVGQMMELRHAMEHPESVGYEARNNLSEAYYQRFTNSFNTASDANDIRPLFLDPYHTVFHSTPVFIGEYHSPEQKDLEQDLEEILGMAKDHTTLLTGLSFVEFQVRYDRGGSELASGIFDLGDAGVDGGSAPPSNAGQSSIRCLAPRQKPAPLTTVAPQDLPHCGWLEADVEYEVEAWWTVNIANVTSAKACCGHCGTESQCQSWTWVNGANSCWLKDGRPSSKTRKSKPGYVSGLPPPRKSGTKHSSKQEQTDEWPSGSAAEGGAEATTGSKTLIFASITRAFGGRGLSNAQLCPFPSVAQ